MAKKLTQGKIMDSLDWAYDKALTPIPALDSAGELAEDYLGEDGSLRDQVNSLIRWQNTKCGTVGFVTGLPGIIAMPVTLPADIACVFYVQLRMVAAIAIMGGYEPENDKVRTLAYACMCGSATAELLRGAGIQLGKKLTQQAIKSITGKTLTKINQAVGFRLFTKFGEKGIVNFGKGIPLVGAIVGATLDAVTTNTIGNAARDAFIGKID